VADKYVNIPIFIPEYACPFQCVFCNQKKITNKSAIPSKEEIISIIDQHLSSIDLKKTEVKLAYFGGSFTGIPIEEQIELLKIPQKYIESGKISGIRISTRPDYINQEILNLLKEFNVVNIELGAQSLDDEVLKKAGRGHSAQDVEEASKLIKRNGFQLGLQMMTGLPGDNIEKALQTAKKIIELKADETRIYPTIVIKDTALHKHYESEKYKPQTLEEAVKISAKLYTLFKVNDVKILRIGLYAGENLSFDKDYIAGPIHQAFKEMVLSEVWREKFEIEASKTKNISKILINPSDLNHAIGYKSSNKIYLQNQFPKVRFEVDKSIEIGEFRCL